MDGAEQYVELLAQTGSENEADIKEEHLETNEDLDSSNTYSGVISGTDDDFHKLKNVVCKLEQISDRLALAAIDDQYEHFGKYLATLLRGIPKKKFLSLKQKFVNDIIQAKMALDESTTSSLVTGNCTVTESVVDPIGVGNESSCLDNTCHCSTSKRLQSKGNASEQNVVPVSKTCTNSEPLKVLIIPPTPTITPPVFCPPILLAGDGNSTNNSSSNSLLARKRKRLMTSVPSKKLKKKPRCQPYINYIHHQDEQKTSDEPLPSQATEAVAHAHPLSVTEDHVEIEDENQSENEVSSIDDSDADPLWSPGHINEPTNPGSVVSDIDDACQSSSLAEQETVAERANKLLQLDNLSSSECKPQSPSTDMLGMTVEELDGMPKDKLLQLLESREETLEGTQESVAIVRKVLKIILGLDKPDEEASEDGNEDIMQLDSTEDLSQNVDEENISEENQEINTTVRKTLLGTDNPEEKVSADEDGDVGKLDSTKDNSQMAGTSGASHVGSRKSKSDSFHESWGDTVEKNRDKYKIQRKGARKRQNFCLFCQKLVTNFGRHIVRWHPKEKEVLEYLSVKDTNLKERKLKRQKISRDLRNRGNFLYNITKPIGEDFLASKRKLKNADPSKLPTPSDYRACQFCLCTLKKKRFYAHVKNCVKNVAKKC